MVGVGVQHEQFVKFPIKLHIGGASHWQASLNPVIINPLAQDNVKDNVHLFIHED